MEAGREQDGPQLKLRPDALDWVDVEEEVVVLDSERSVYLSTNPAGAIIWRKLIKGSTRQELSGALVETFGISEDRAEQDVEKFVSRLSELGLLATSDG